MPERAVPEKLALEGLVNMTDNTPVTSTVLPAVVPDATAEVSRDFFSPLFFLSSLLVSSMSDDRVASLATAVSWPLMGMSFCARWVP